MYTLNISALSASLLVIGGMVKNQAKVVYCLIDGQGEALAKTRWKTPDWNFFPNSLIPEVVEEATYVGEFSDFKEFFKACNEAYKDSVSEPETMEEEENPFLKRKAQPSPKVAPKVAKVGTVKVSQPIEVEAEVREIQAFEPTPLPEIESAPMLLSRERREKVLENLESLTRKQIMVFHDKLPGIVQMAEFAATTPGTEADYNRRTRNVNSALRQLGIDGRYIHFGTTSLNDLWSMCFLIKDGLQALLSGETLTDDPAPVETSAEPQEVTQDASTGVSLDQVQAMIQESNANMLAQIASLLNK